MNCSDPLNPIAYGDFLTEECQKAIQVYDDWNSEVRKLHEHNSHLYFSEIRLREPPPNERPFNARFSRNLSHYTPPIDPVPTALEQLDFQIKYSDPDARISEEAIKFQLTHTIAHYREEQKKREPDPSLLVNQIHLHGADEVTAHMNEIPNSSSIVGSPDMAANRRLRQMRMRRVAFETAQSARGDHPLEVPKELRRLKDGPPAKTRPFPKLKVFRDHRETKKKIAQLEKAYQESLAGSARHIREINRMKAAREAGEKNGMDLW
jgi:hypothetical protein